MSRPSDKYILDNGGSVSYRGYELHTGEFDGRTGYYGKHSNGVDAVGPFWNLVATKRAIDGEAESNPKPAEFKRFDPIACATCCFLKYETDSAMHVCQRDDNIQFVPADLLHFFHVCELYRRVGK
jgi:hypothetical protein